MGRHEDAGVGQERQRVIRGVAVVLVLAALSALVAHAATGSPEAFPQPWTSGCDTVLRVAAPASFARVVTQVAADLGSGPDCVRVFVGQVDGRTVAERIGQLDVDAWIADDPAWTTLGSRSALAQDGVAGAGAVLATSPVFMVTDPATAKRITRGGGSWLALARLLTTAPGVRLAVPDPAGSGEGLVAVGALSEAVWLDQGMEVSAYALSRIFTRTRTVPGERLVRPDKRGEVALVAEHVLLTSGWRPDAGNVALTGQDHTALLRYTWLPTAAAAADPAKSAALGRLLTALTGLDASAARAAAGLRGPTGKASVASTTAGLPNTTALPFDTLSRHKVQHVFAVWYPDDRRAKLLLAVDVSGSMAEPAPGTQTPLISFVRDGCLAIGNLLPPDGSLTLWAFGSQLDPPRDYRVLLPAARMSALPRNALPDAVSRLVARPTGTGLHDTILAAYQQAVATYVAGEPNRVMIFTDGRDEDDPGSISPDQLASRLAAAADPARPVDLELIAFGNQPQVGALAKAVRPVGGVVETLDSADRVVSVFVHLAAVGVHG
jgi:hypothetical protein